VLLALIAVGAGLVAGWRSGGRLTNVARAHVRYPAALVAGAALGLAAELWPAGHPGSVLSVTGYVLLCGFALINIRLTGMVLVSVGLMANLAVVAADGGMPVRDAAPGVSLGSRHHGQRPGDHLVGLSDVVAVPILDETVSAGDIVLILGAATLTWGLMSQATETPSRRAERGKAGRRMRARRPSPT
jgi:hypothetical protein